MDICIRLVVLLILFSWLQAAYEIPSANDYFDAVLNSLKTNQNSMFQLDPLKLPDYKNDQVRITDITVRGVSSLHRVGNSTIYYRNEKIYFTAHLAVNDIFADAKYAVNFILNLQGEASAFQKVVEVKIVVSIDVNTDAKTLEEFRITEFGEIEIKRITGSNVVVGKITKWVAPIFTGIWKKEIVDVIEHTARKMIEEKIREFDFM